MALAPTGSSENVLVGDPSLWRTIMSGLKLATRLLCILAFMTGIVDMFAGVRLLIAGGGHLAGVATDPVLNSQVGRGGEQPDAAVPQSRDGVGRRQAEVEADHRRRHFQ